jgi:hypothetical protein
MKRPTAEEFIKSKRIYPHMKYDWECESVYSVMTEFAEQYAQSEYIKMKFTKKDMKKFAAYFADSWHNEAGVVITHMEKDVKRELKNWIKKHAPFMGLLNSSK